MSEEISPNGMRVFTVKHPKLPENKCTLGIQLGNGQAQFVLLRATPPKDEYDHPLLTRLSSVVSNHPVINPDADGRYSFWMKTYSENEGALEQMIEQGIVEKDPRPEVQQGFVKFPLVHVKIPLNQMSKQCGSCERWEVAVDEERMRACSRCLPQSKTWYCDAECQKDHWTGAEGAPPHKKLCGKTSDFVNAGIAHELYVTLKLRLTGRFVSLAVQQSQQKMLDDMGFKTVSLG